MLKAKASPIEQRDFLLAAATWQETLLQSYRSLHVTIQGFLIAAGAAVLAVQLTSAMPEQTEKLLVNAILHIVFTFLLTLLFWLQRKTAKEFEGVVKSRATDIDHWHIKTMLSENAFEPEQRAFTYFKMWQQSHRADVEHLLIRSMPEEGLSESAASELVGKGHRHTRRVVDVNLFERLLLLSRIMLITSFALSSWFVLIWSRSLLFPGV